MGPLARLNVADRCGTPAADAELAEFRQRCGRMVHSAFHYHYARLIELLHGLEKIERLLADPAILDTHVRARAAVNSLEGVGMIEAPRGVLIHHYKVDEKGAIVWANLIVATGHNNLAINRGVKQVAQALRGWRQAQGRHVEPGVRAGAGLRSVPELLDARGRDAGHASHTAGPAGSGAGPDRVAAPRRSGARREAKVERRKVTLTSKPVVDRATAKGLEDVRKGRLRGPFDTVDEMIDSLKGRNRQKTAKAS